jgi:carbonic anhydrase
MQTLLDGYKRFRQHGWPNQKKMFENLADAGQSPKALVIACVDSRIDPVMIFDANPGDILSVRNVANLVPPYKPDSNYHGTSAALEFGITVLNIPNIVVLGHAQCGGVQALLKGTAGEKKDFISSWMHIADSALHAARECAIEHEQQTCCEHKVIRLSITNLMTFPWIADRVQNGALKINGMWLDIRSGELLLLQDNGTFELIA